MRHCVGGKSDDPMNKLLAKPVHRHCTGLLLSYVTGPWRILNTSPALTGKGRDKWIESVQRILSEKLMLRTFKVGNNRAYEHELQDPLASILMGCSRLAQIGFRGHETVVEMPSWA